MEYLSLSLISTMGCYGIVKELDLYSLSTFDYLASSYIHSKSYKLSLSGSSSLKYSKIELVIVNLTGLISVPTWDNYLYTPIIVEINCYYPVDY